MSGIGLSIIRDYLSKVFPSYILLTLLHYCKCCFETERNSAVGLSKILDSELTGRNPSERPHGEVVCAAVMDSELLFKIVQRVKSVAVIESFLVLPVAALHLSVVPGGIGTDEFVPDP